MNETIESNFELRRIESKVEFERDISHDKHPEVTPRELWSWYTFDFASQPFSSAAMGIFIPLILENLAWAAGTSDPTDPLNPPCMDMSTIPQNTAGDVTYPCFVKFGAIMTTPASFALYVTSISVAVQVVFFISFGAFADYSKWRKHMLTGFSVFNALVCFGFLAVITPGTYPYAAFLTVLGNVSYGTAMVFYNAYLPLLVEAHPKVRQAKYKAQLKLDYDFTGDDDLNVVEVENDLGEVKDKTANEISTKGFAFGYVGGVLSLLIFAAMLYGIGTSTFVMQLCVALCGVWLLAGLLVVTIPFLKTRPGPPLPSNETSYFLFSWKKTFKTFAKAKQLKHAFLFLISWFFYSDGYSTIAQTAILYGKTQLFMTNLQLMVISIIAPFAAVLGNYFFFYLFKERMNISSVKSTIILICLVAVIPLWGILGFAFPANWKIGMRSVDEMYVMGAYYGFILGALQSFSRALFSELIPSGMESEFFALYEITDRGSAWLGPLLVGIFTQNLGARYGFIAIFLLLCLSLPFLLMVNLDKGRRQAKAFQIE